MAEGEETSSDESQESNSSANQTAIVMSLLERLLRSHPVWFLPGIQRSGAIHLLQGKEEGVGHGRVQTVWMLPYVHVMFFLLLLLDLHRARF